MIETVYLWFRDIFLSIWTALTTFISNFFYTIYDTFLGVIESMVTAIDVPSSWSSAGNPL